jgi:hypothetical protein
MASSFPFRTNQLNSPAGQVGVEDGDEREKQLGHA